MRPTKHKYTVLKQICQCIPPHLAPKLARAFGADKKARSFSPWSHIVALLHVQLAHSLSLNDVSDIPMTGRDVYMDIVVTEGATQKPV